MHYIVDSYFAVQTSCGEKNIYSEVVFGTSAAEYGIADAEFEFLDDTVENTFKIVLLNLLVNYNGDMYDGSDMHRMILDATNDTYDFENVSILKTPEILEKFPRLREIGDVIPRTYNEFNESNIWNTFGFPMCTDFKVLSITKHTECYLSISPGVPTRDGYSINFLNNPKNTDIIIESEREEQDSLFDSLLEEFVFDSFNSDDQEDINVNLREIIENTNKQPLENRLEYLRMQTIQFVFELNNLCEEIDRIGFVENFIKFYCRYENINISEMDRISIIIDLIKLNIPNLEENKYVNICDAFINIETKISCYIEYTDFNSLVLWMAEDYDYLILNNNYFQGYRNRIISLTGILNTDFKMFSREDAISLINEFGGIYTDNVEESNLLIAGEKGGKKISKANELNIPVIDFSIFIKIYELLKVILE